MKVLLWLAWSYYNGLGFIYRVWCLGNRIGNRLASIDLGIDLVLVRLVKVLTISTSSSNSYTFHTCKDSKK